MFQCFGKKLQCERQIGKGKHFLFFSVRRRLSSSQEQKNVLENNFQINGRQIACNNMADSCMEMERDGCAEAIKYKSPAPCGIGDLYVESRFAGRFIQPQQPDVFP